MKEGGGKEGERGSEGESGEEGRGTKGGERGREGETGDEGGKRCLEERREGKSEAKGIEESDVYK